MVKKAEESFWQSKEFFIIMNIIRILTFLLAVSFFYYLYSEIEFIKLLLTNPNPCDIVVHRFPEITCFPLYN